jgi:hypothetical protein
MGANRQGQEEAAMQRDIVGDWGRGLDDAAYGQALAALGVLEASGVQQHQASADPLKILAALQEEFKDGERTVVWREAQNVGDWTTPETWRQTIHGDAQALAEGWLLLLQSADHPRRRPRLAVKAAWRRRPDLFDFNALMGWLESHDTGCQALVLVPDDPGEQERRTLWHWPLRLGVPAGADGEALLDYLRGIRNGWIEELGILQPVGEARDACDLLILPAGMAARLAEQPRLYLQASFIVCLDNAEAWSAAGKTPQARLLAKMGAAGIASEGQSVDPRSWYEMLMRELSHDLPVHAAVWRTGQHFSGIRPVVMGEPEALDRLRIAAIGDRIDRKVEMMAPPSRRLPQEPKDTARFFGYEVPCDLGGEPEIEKVRRPSAWRELGAEIRSRPFSHETVDGLPMAEAIAKKTGEVEKKRILRYIQARAWREDARVKPVRALAPQRPSVLAVHIGPSAEPLLGPFPDHQFDFSAGPVALTVQIAVAEASVAAIAPEGLSPYERNWVEFQDHDAPKSIFQLADSLVPPLEPEVAGKTRLGVASAGIRLPLAGDSSPAVFAVRPQAGVTEVTGRIAIIHQNRIVQTARLTASVGQQAYEGPEIAVEPEAIVHPRLDDLAERRQFDAALLFSNPLGGLIVSCEGKDHPIPLDNLKDPVETIRTALHQGIKGWDYSKLLKDQPTLQPILLELASSGRLLYDLLQDKLGQEIVESERVQLLCCGNAFFPLEYLYQGPPPKSDPEAEVCPTFLAGECKEIGTFRWTAASGQPGCAGNYAKSEAYLCPMHFWGFTKVIERHGAPPPSEAGEAEKTEEQKRFPVPSREPFGPIKSVLYAAAAKAFLFRATPQEREAERLDLEKALGALGSPTNVATWDDWKNCIRQDSPNLLVLVVHTDKKVDRMGLKMMDVLEIGDGKLLGKHEIIGNKEALIGKKGEKQLLLLIGCSTAGVTDDFAPYSELFQKAGADVILAPLASIRGADALAIAKRIATLLGERLSGEFEVAFGELLRELRQKMLAQGHPGVLGLVGFGDADWVFGGHYA